MKTKSNLKKQNLPLKETPLELSIILFHLGNLLYIYIFLIICLDRSSFYVEQVPLINVTGCLRKNLRGFTIPDSMSDKTTRVEQVPLIG